MIARTPEPAFGKTEGPAPDPMRQQTQSTPIAAASSFCYLSPMSSQGSFSVRNGYEQPDKIVYRGEIPVAVRTPMLEVLQWYADPEFLWGRIEIVANRYGAGKLLRESCPIPRADGVDFLSKIRGFLVLCPWFYIFDLIEDIFAQLSSGEGAASPDAGADSFELDINDHFVQAGIGWQLVNGKFEIRGAEDLKDAVSGAGAELRSAHQETAAQHIQSAWQVLSQRPAPDLRGAIGHAMSAFECVARELTGEPRASMEEILRHHPHMLPRPVENAMNQLWTYVSRQALVWGRGEKKAWYFAEVAEPAREDAEMIVALAATMTTYLLRKHGSHRN